MSYLGVVLLSVFSANVFLTYGLGACDVLRKSSNGGLFWIVALVAANFIASALLWSANTLILIPLGLTRFSILVFALFVAPLIKFLTQLINRTEALDSRSLLARLDEITLSCLVYGIALMVTRRGYTIEEALLASVASVLGYAGALTLLIAIRKRMEVSSIPEPLRRGPALLLSAGLMAMAFSGIDSYFIAGLVK